MNLTTRHYYKNTRGRDFIVGDVHGYFDELRNALLAIEFDVYKDRLFSVGDLVDRGHKSINATDWLSQPWFHAVRGNHEDFAIRYASKHHDELRPPPTDDQYKQWGGQWFVDLSKTQQESIARIFKMLPIGISVDTDKGPVGIIHADLPKQWTKWATLEEFCMGVNPKNAYDNERLVHQMLFSRNRLKTGCGSTIEDLHMLIVGHTSVFEETVVQNVHYIDTYRLSRFFTLKQIQ
jgi:serine/threonine protein phosphatase 1